MLIGWVMWILAGTFLLAVTVLVHRTLRTDRPALNAASLVFLHMLLTTSYLMALGLVGWLRPIPSGMFAFVGLLGLVGLRASRRELQEVLREVAGMSAQLRAVWATLPRWLKALTIVGAAAGAARFAFLVWALPPFAWDSLTYHLTNVAQWTQQGRIATFETPIDRIYSPANYEVYATWFTVFLHHDAFVEAAGLPAYLLSCVAVYGLARGLGLTSTAAWIAAMAYATTPGLVLATTATKNDPHAAALFLFATAIIVDLYPRPAQQRRGLLQPLAVLTGVLLYALGTKAYVLHLATGLVVLAAAAALTPGQRRVWCGVVSRTRSQWAEVRSGGRVGVALVLSASLFLGLYWYARNWAITGNPFFPYGVTIGHIQLVEGPTYAFPLALDRLVQNLTSLAERFGDKNYHIIESLHETTGWGWFAYGLGIPATLWALARRPEFRMPMFAFCVALLALFLSTSAGPWNMRYVIWFPAIFAVGFGGFFDWLPKAFRLERVALACLLAVCLGLNWVLTVNYNRVTPEQFAVLLALPVWDRDAAKLRVYVPEEYEQALLIVPRNELLGYNIHANAFQYPLYRANLSQRVVYVPLSDGADCREVVDAMHTRGTRWLFVAQEMTPSSVLSRVSSCLEEGYLMSPGRGVYVIAGH